MSETQTATIPDIKEVFQHLDRVRPELEKHAPQLVQTIDTLARKSSDPEERGSEQFRTRVGQALQDAERVLGPVLPKDHALRPEMDMRGVTMPGLEVPEVAHLLSQTPDIASQPMVDRIRGLAHDTASMGRDQRDNPEIEHAVGLVTRDLAQSPRLSQGAVAHEPRSATAPEPVEPHSEAGSEHPSAPHEPPAPTEPHETAPPHDPDHDTKLHASPGGGSVSHAPGDEQVAVPPTDAPTSRATSEQPSSQEKATTPEAKADTAASKNTSANNRDNAKTPEADELDKKEQPTVVVRGPGVFGRILDAIRPSTITPEQKVMTPAWVQKVNKQTAHHVAREDNETVARAEHWGARATRALDALQQAPASTVMAEISSAAQNDPGGMDAVLGGMKPGGRYEALHGKFREQQANNQAFAAQLKEAGDAVAAYGDHRAKVEDVGARRGTGAELSQKFQGLDAEVGEKAGKVPGKEPGKSMLDAMGEKIREVVKKAVTLAANLIRPSPSASASPSP
ncbi:hypothetical protein [Acetobacter sp. UBA5411]|uniref:hypothetical protein n=1 Tax=Acetobacter sp. UBA5411 TaxID=1945905 RepID=UPI0025C11783|nr:hypothetical protein [Acetobacter sp. UBA5411]